MKGKRRSKKAIGIALAAIMIASVLAVAPMASATEGREEPKQVNIVEIINDLGEVIIIEEEGKSISKLEELSHVSDEVLVAEYDKQEILKLRSDVEVYEQTITNAPGMDEYRWYNQDFGWAHTFDSTGKKIISATLEIRAWDVDWGELWYMEHNIIYAEGHRLGELKGWSGTWSTTTFEIDPALATEILEDGEMYVFVDVDSTHTYRCWAVTIDYSKLTIEYTTAPPEEKLIEDYFPYYYFSSGEQYYPCSFYFDNDADVENNHENYDARKGMWWKDYIYVHTVEDDRYFTILYWLYSVFNYHPFWRNHENDWDSTVFVVFDKGNFSQPTEVRFAHHYFIGNYSWDEVEKTDDTHVVAYVANGSHGSYRSADMGSLDIWENGGIMYTPSVFNWYLVENCVGEVNRLVDTEFRTFCNVTNQLVRGEEQYEPVEGYWPRHFAVGASHDPSAPWHHRDNRWFTTRPEGWHSALEFGVDCPVNLHIYDLLDRHIGINYTTGEPEIQIPDAIYLIKDAQYIMIPDPIEGDYRVEIVGLENGTYNFSMICSEDMKLIGLDERDNIPIAKGEVQTFIINPWAAIAATVRIEPETLNLASQGVFTAFIQLPEGYDVADINVSTVVCEEAPAVRGHIADGDTFIAKFDREDLKDDLPTGDAVELTVTGKLKDGTPFEGSDTIRVIDKGKGGK